VSTKHPGPLILVVEAVEETRQGIDKLLTADGYSASGSGTRTSNPFSVTDTRQYNPTK
jgi:CheY-like chemotaxis protein